MRVIEDNQAQETINWKDNNDDTALLHAAERGLSDIVRTLLEYGADPAIIYQSCRLGILPRTAAQTCHDWDSANVGTVSILESAERVWAFNALPEWRPRTHQRFPSRYRAGICTLVILSRARNGYVKDKKNKPVETIASYPQACLEMLPPEILQYMFIFLTATPVAEKWTI